MDYTEIKFDVRDDGIATMTLNRADKLNSFTRKMFEEWKDVVALYHDAKKGVEFKELFDSMRKSLIEACRKGFFDIQKLRDMLATKPSGP